MLIPHNSNFLFHSKLKQLFFFLLIPAVIFSFPTFLKKKYLCLNSPSCPLLNSKSDSSRFFTPVRGFTPISILFCDFFAFIRLLIFLALSWIYFDFDFFIHYDFLFDYYIFSHFSIFLSLFDLFRYI